MSTEDSVLTLVDLYAAERASRGHEPRRRIRRARQRLAGELGRGVPKAVAARVLGTSVNTLDKWIAREQIRTVKAPSGRVLVDSGQLVGLAAEVQALRALGQQDGLVAAAIGRLEHASPSYRREFAELYGQSLAAADRGDLAPLTIPASFGPDD